MRKMRLMFCVILGLVCMVQCQNSNNNNNQNQPNNNNNNNQNQQQNGNNQGNSNQGAYGGPLQGMANPILLSIQTMGYNGFDMVRGLVQVPLNMLNSAQKALRGLFNVWTFPNFTPPQGDAISNSDSNQNNQNQNGNTRRGNNNGSNNNNNNNNNNNRNNG